MTDAFWRDPPWRGGNGGYRMGLHPIPANSWLPDRITPAERSRKESLLADKKRLVFAALESSRSGQQMIRGAVKRFICRNGTGVSTGHALIDPPCSFPMICV